MSTNPYQSPLGDEPRKWRPLIAQNLLLVGLILFGIYCACGGGCVTREVIIGRMIVAENAIDEDDVDAEKANWAGIGAFTFILFIYVAAVLFLARPFLRKW